ncbi:GbsR/MarR family transcriptional regulator [Prauserella muralis]|uniref:MarR family transcriptional regulator n=1 Tax=Prauserella muralis TaxID=588067 RepID=A0A2V4B823_9PSEU|nr:MarR family transcriptional regulator [Prauserella muralis]PXY31306.1 MarR family transcriptional regulator [Prauserella muralis]TWE14377.1 DNA-binding transcriptional regulator GbsR (MarR family) [Prauserella muralis]
MSSRPQSQRDPAEGRDEEAVRNYIENLALTLTQIGLQRMPARVFSALTVSDSGRMTSAELAETLSVSPAAISGAVRYLEQVGFVAKERLPGERRDHYTLFDDLWYASFLKRDRMMRLWRDATIEGVAAVGADTPAGRRLTRMADFLDFMVKEIPALFERWHAEQERRDDA